MALDLRSLRRARSLLQCIRRGCAVIPEDSGDTYLGSDAEGAAVSGRSTLGVGDFRGDWHFRGEEVPRRTTVVRPSGMEEF